MINGTSVACSIINPYPFYTVELSRKSVRRIELNGAMNEVDFFQYKWSLFFHDLNSFSSTNFFSSNFGGGDIDRSTFPITAFTFKEGRGLYVFRLDVNNRLNNSTAMVVVEAATCSEGSFAQNIMHIPRFTAQAGKDPLDLVKSVAFHLKEATKKPLNTKWRLVAYNPKEAVYSALSTQLLVSQAAGRYFNQILAIGIVFQAMFLLQ